jgi:hypothetical protein
MAMAGKLAPGSQAASVREQVRAIGSSASAGRHRICRVPGWAPGGSVLGLADRAASRMPTT